MEKNKNWDFSARTRNAVLIGGFHWMIIQNQNMISLCPFPKLFIVRLGKNSVWVKIMKHFHTKMQNDPHISDPQCRKQDIRWYLKQKSSGQPWQVYCYRRRRNLFSTYLRKQNKRLKAGILFQDTLHLNVHPKIYLPFLDRSLILNGFLCFPEVVVWISMLQKLIFLTSTVCKYHNCSK